MSEMEQALDELVYDVWMHGIWGDLSPRTKSETSEQREAVLSLYSTAIRERDEARALATEAGACLENTLGSWDDYFAQSADGIALSLRVNAALAALWKAKWEA